MLSDRKAQSIPTRLGYCDQGESPGTLYLSPEFGLTRYLTWGTRLIEGLAPREEPQTR